MPVPLYWALKPETTSQVYAVEWKFMFPTWKLNSVSPVGTVAPFLYCELKPKFARPLSVGSAVYEPAPTLMKPPPVMNPPFGS